MADSDTTTGAMPGTGATPGQAGQQQPTTPPPAGATPPAGTTATAAATPPATGEEALGDAGKKVLADARRAAKDAEARARAAEEERDALRTATQTEQEKAIEAARKEAASEADAKWQVALRHAHVLRALTAAGISRSELELAASAPEFGQLPLTDKGEVEDLDPTVDTFRTGHPGLFAAATGPSGSIDGGARGTPSSGEQVRQAEADGDWRTSISLKNRQLAEQAQKKR